MRLETIAPLTDLSLSTVTLALSALSIVLGYTVYRLRQADKKSAKRAESPRKTSKASADGSDESIPRRSEKGLLRNITPMERKRIQSIGICYLLFGVLLAYLGLISKELSTSILLEYPYIQILFEDRIIFFVLAFSMAGGVANVFQNTILGNKNVTLYKNLEEQRHLFVDETQYLLLMRKFLINAYSKSWNFWIEVQPLLSTIVGIIIYFVFVSGISWSGSIQSEPNVFFFSTVAFLSGFFYDRFLDFLQKISGQLLGSEDYDERIMRIVNEFVEAKGKIIETSRTESTKVRSEIKKRSRKGVSTEKDHIKTP